MKNKILYFIIAILLIIVIFQSCPKGDEHIERIIVTDTIYGDTIEHWKVVYSEPDTIWEDGEIITLPPDSVCIVEWLKLNKEYNKYKIYKDTLQDDSIMLAGVIDTVHQNKLWGRAFFYKNRKETIINTTINNTIINNADGIYAGGGFIGNNFGAEVNIIKNKWEFDIGTYNKQIKAGVKYKIFGFK